MYILCTGVINPGIFLFPMYLVYSLSNILCYFLKFNIPLLNSINVSWITISFVLYYVFGRVRKLLLLFALFDVLVIHVWRKRDINIIAMI